VLLQVLSLLAGKASSKAQFTCFTRPKLVLLQVLSLLALLVVLPQVLSLLALLVTQASAATGTQFTCFTSNQNSTDTDT
jgi:hypothetical protein